MHSPTDMPAPHPPVPSRAVVAHASIGAASATHIHPPARSLADRAVQRVCIAPQMENSGTARDANMCDCKETKVESVLGCVMRKTRRAQYEATGRNET